MLNPGKVAPRKRIFAGEVRRSTIGLQLKEYTQIAPRCKISGDPQQKTIIAVMYML
jgi:hypothetical protein